MDMWMDEWMNVGMWLAGTLDGLVYGR